MNGFAGLRVGLVGPLPPPAGGMAMQTRQLAELLVAAQAQVTLVQTNRPYRPAFVAGWPGVRALFRLLPYLGALWRATGRSDVMHLMANSGWSWHLFAAPAIWIARWRRVPVVVNYRGGEAGKFLARSERVVRASMRIVARLIVPSGFLRQVFDQHGIAAEVVPNVVDLARFRPAEAAAGAARRLLVARNLEPIYDNATALRAFVLVLRRWPDTRLTLAGTGPEGAMLTALAAELGIAANVDFVGRLDSDTMAAMLRDSAVAINPSLVDNMPNSVLEALASGVPVVSTEVGGVPYMVKDGVTALLVPPKDPEAMAHAIGRVLEDAALAARLREAGLAEAHLYSWDRVAPVLSAVYQQAVGRGRR